MYGLKLKFLFNKCSSLKKTQYDPDMQDVK